MFPQQNLLINFPDIFVTSEAHFHLFDVCIKSLLPLTEQQQTLKVIRIVWPHVCQNPGGLHKLIMVYKIEYS